jgi:hypothetical protein
MRRALRKEFSWTKPRAGLWGLNWPKEWRQVVAGTSARWPASGKARKRGPLVVGRQGSRCGEAEVERV